MLPYDLNKRPDSGSIPKQKFLKRFQGKVEPTSIFADMSFDLACLISLFFRRLGLVENFLHENFVGSMVIMSDSESFL